MRIEIRDTESGWKDDYCIEAVAVVNAYD